MSIATYKTAIKTWVEAQAGITAQWQGEAGGWQGKTRARLHLLNYDGVGVDVIQWNYDDTLDPGEDLVPTFAGVRQVTLTIDITSRDQSGSNVAHSYLAALRRSLQKPSVKTLLRAAGLAFATVEATADLTNLVDNRHESRATMDVLFNAVENERDVAEADSWVETYKIDATLKDEGGNDHHDNGEEDYP